MVTTTTTASSSPAVRFAISGADVLESGEGSRVPLGLLGGGGGGEENDTQ